MTINIITGKTSRVCQENNNLTLFLGLLVILAYIFIRTFFSFFVSKYYCCPELSKRTETVYILSVSLFHFFFDSHFFSPEHFSMNECNEIYCSVITLWSKKRKYQAWEILWNPYFIRPNYIIAFISLKTFIYIYIQYWFYYSSIWVLLFYVGCFQVLRSFESCGMQTTPSSSLVLFSYSYRKKKKNTIVFMDKFVVFYLEQTFIGQGEYLYRKYILLLFFTPEKCLFQTLILICRKDNTLTMAMVIFCYYFHTTIRFIPFFFFFNYLKLSIKQTFFFI